MVGVSWGLDLFIIQVGPTSFQAAVRHFPNEHFTSMTALSCSCTTGLHIYCHRVRPCRIYVCLRLADATLDRFNFL